MTTKVDICNNALDLVGQGTHISDLQNEQSKEADLCRRLFDLELERALDKFNFSFARKDEIITNDYLLEDAVSFPYEYSYTLPSDVQRILYLSEVTDNPSIEKIRTETIDYNFRVLDNQKVLVTNHKAPFVIQYQAKVTNIDLFSATFIQAFEYQLASRLAPALVHGTTGVQIGTNHAVTATQLFNICAGQDAQQGSNSIKPESTPSFISARG